MVFPAVKSKLDSTNLYDEGYQLFDENFKELKTIATNAFGAISREIKWLKQGVEKTAISAYRTDYRPQTMVLLFSIPVVGDIFCALKELDYAQKFLAADSSEQRAKIIDLKNEMIRSQIASVIIKTTLFVALGVLLTPVAAFYAAQITVQFFRLDDNEEALKQYNFAKNDAYLFDAF